jgi:Mg-chelatase subunit ChlD
MNPDVNPTPPEEREARITALLLGELAPDVAAEVRQQLEHDPELAKLHARLERALPLIREAARDIPGSESASRGEVRLSEDRRERLLRQFKVIPLRRHSPERRRERYGLPLTLAAVLVAMLIAAWIFLDQFGFPQAHRQLSLTKLGNADGGGRGLENAEVFWYEHQAQVTAPGVQPAPAPPAAARALQVERRRYRGVIEAAKEPETLARLGRVERRSGNGAEPAPTQEVPPAAAVPTPEASVNFSIPTVGNVLVREAPGGVAGGGGGFGGAARVDLSQAPPDAARAIASTSSLGVEKTKDAMRRAAESQPVTAGKPKVALGDFFAYVTNSAVGGDKAGLLQLGDLPAVGHLIQAPDQARLLFEDRKGVAAAKENEALASAAGGTYGFGVAAVKAPTGPGTEGATLDFDSDGSLDRMVRDPFALRAEQVPALRQFARADEGAIARVEAVPPSAPAESAAPVLGQPVVRGYFDEAEASAAAPVAGGRKVGEPGGQPRGEAVVEGRIAGRPAAAQQPAAVPAEEVRQRLEPAPAENAPVAGVALATVEAPAEKIDPASQFKAARDSSESGRVVEAGTGAGAARDRLMLERYGLIANGKQAGAELALRQKLAEVAPAAAPAPTAAVTDIAEKRVSPSPEPQPEIQTSANPFSTFSLNVSDVSFKLTAAALEGGAMPEPATIRTEEFLNAFDYRDPLPPPGVPVAFAWNRAQDPFAHNRDLVRLSVKTAAQGRESGRALNLVLLLDSSGSMERADRVQIIREAVRVLASQLQAADRVSVVTFARTARLWVDGLPGNEAGQLVERFGSLIPEGGTNLEDALRVAYEAAARRYVAEGVNRVVLLTDGAANLGNVDPDSLQTTVEAQRQRGIALDCFGIGWEGYNDDLLEVLSRHGDGRYGFINTPEEAATGFAAQLAGALQVAAADVKVQVEFNPRRVTAYRQIGYAKHQLTKEQFRDNTVDAAEIGAAEAGNALYVVQIDPRGEGPLGAVRVRYMVPGTADYREQEWTLAYDGAAVALDRAPVELKLAGVAAAFAEWLAASPYAGEVTPDRLLALLQGVPEHFSLDPRPRQLEWMIRQAKSISGK